MKLFKACVHALDFPNDVGALREDIFLVEIELAEARGSAHTRDGWGADVHDWMVRG